MMPSRLIPPFIREVAKLWRSRWVQTLRSTRLYDMLCDRGFRGSARTVRLYVATVRPQKRREVFLHTEPMIGEQAQVDWAYAGKIPVPGGERALWLFVIVLSYSRALWGESVLDLSVQSLARRPQLRPRAWARGRTTATETGRQNVDHAIRPAAGWSFFDGRRLPST